MQLGVSMQALVLNRLNIDDLATVADQYGMHMSLLMEIEIQWNPAIPNLWNADILF